MKLVSYLLLLSAACTLHAGTVTLTGSDESVTVNTIDIPTTQLSIMLRITALEAKFAYHEGHAYKALQQIKKDAAANPRNPTLQARLTALENAQ